MFLGAYRDDCPEYIMTKNKIELTQGLNVDGLLEKVALFYSDHEIDTQDGVKVYIDNGWAHLRKSNTEPIIRLYTEGRDASEADAIARQVHQTVQQWL